MKERSAATFERVNPALKWHIDGGKHYLADWIIGNMPPRCKNPNAPASDDDGWLHYVEPFFGGGSVLFALDPNGISEVANDLNKDLSNFWMVLRDAHVFPMLQRAISCCPFSRVEYTRMSAILDAEWSGIPFPQVQRAAAFFVCCRQSMSGRMDSFAPLTRNRTRRGMNEQASAWLSAIEGLPAVHERLKRVVVLNDKACKVIAQQDGPRTLFYLDPPYLHETRSTTGEYAHEMTREQHVELLGMLTNVKGRFILSGYPSDLYEAWRKVNGYRVVTKEIDNKAASGKSKAAKTECLWFNF